MKSQSEFKLNSTFIELDNLLKVANLVSSGSEAKKMIQAGVLKVNGVVESKVRRKLHVGDLVDFKESKILVT